MSITTEADFEYRIARLRLEERDVLVVKVSKLVPDEIHRHIQQNVRNILGARTKVLVVDTALDISILTAAEIEERSIVPTSDEAAV